MNKKRIIIFITVFILVGLILFGVYLLLNKSKTTTTTGATPWYQSFNPFGSGGTTTTEEPAINEPGGTQGLVEEETSRFYKITNFAVAGATFLNDTRPIIYSDTDTIQAPEPVETIIDATIKEGRKEIQTILNETVSPVPPLVVDGVFGKSVTKAIKDFQTQKGIEVTGQIDINTAPFFTKTTISSAIETRPLYEESPSIRYVERKNGHIYKMFWDTKIEEKISNTTIPSIYEALFNKTANTVIYRYLSTENVINSYISTMGSPSGEFLPRDISDLIDSPDKTKFFYLTENSNGLNGVVGTYGEQKRDVVFNSPLTEWLSQWVNNQKIFLTTKASYSVNGSIFLLNTTNKTTTKILGGIKGLTTLVNPSGSMVLFSTTTSKGPVLGVFDIEKHTTKDLGVYGLPEKCIWSNDNINIYCALPSVIAGNQYPDYWYQGLVSFDDYFVKINTNNNSSTTIADSKTETVVDATKLFLSGEEDTLFFVNKKDSTLWGLRVEL